MTVQKFHAPRSAGRGVVTFAQYGRPMTNDEFPYTAKRRVDQLIETLVPLVERDPEQEIRGIAVPMLEAVFDCLSTELKGDPVADAMVGVYQHEASTGEPVRAADALLVARQLAAVIGPAPIVIA